MQEVQNKVKSSEVKQIYLINTVCVGFLKQKKVLLGEAELILMTAKIKGRGNMMKSLFQLSLFYSKNGAFTNTAWLFFLKNINYLRDLYPMLCL